MFVDVPAPVGPVGGCAQELIQVIPDNPVEHTLPHDGVDSARAHGSCSGVPRGEARANAQKTIQDGETLATLAGEEASELGQATRRRVGAQAGASPSQSGMQAVTVISTRRSGEFSITSTVVRAGLLAGK